MSSNWMDFDPNWNWHLFPLAIVYPLITHILEPGAVFLPLGPNLHALTCAHVLWGPMAGPTTPPPNSLRVNSLDPTGIYTWKPFGISDPTGRIETGTGSMSDFGYIDYVSIAIPPQVAGMLLPCGR